MARVRSAGEPRLPRVLFRARCRLRRAASAHRVDASRQVRRRVQLDVLGRASLQLARGRVGVRPAHVHPAAGEGLLRDLLRAQQHHRRPGRRLQDRRDQAPARTLLRPPEARSGAARGRDPRAEVARREALLCGGRNVAHGAGVVARRSDRAQGLRGSRPHDRRPLRPHRAPHQGSRPRQEDCE